MRPSRRFLRLLTLSTLLGGAALLALGLHLALSAHLGASAALVSALGGLVVVVSALGLVGSSRDKPRLLLLFFFLCFLLLAGLVVACYASFFFEDALHSWLKRHWSSDALAALRTQSCCGTFDDALQTLHNRLVVVGSVGVFCVLLLLAAMYCVVRIVTVPIVMRSMLGVTNAAFVLLGVGLFVFGLSVKVHDEMTSGQRWMAVIFIVVGTVMVALSVLGIVGSRAKSRSLLLVYVVGLTGCLVALLVCTVSAFALSDNLASTYNQHTSSTLACDIDLPGCTNCTGAVACDGVIQTSSGYWESCNSSSLSGSSSSYNGTCQEGMTVLNAEVDQTDEANDVAACGKCPEWSASDVQAYLRSTLHLLGLFAVVVCLFMIVGFAGALVLRRSLAGYQTDSI